MLKGETVKLQSLSNLTKKTQGGGGFLRGYKYG